MLKNKIKKKSLKINIIPLIDIIFLMLVFFMLATNFKKTKEINFSIDRNISSSTDMKKVLFISLRNDEKFSINDNQISSENFETEFQNLWKSKNFDQVVLLNDQISKIEILISTIDILKKNNVENISFADDFNK